MKFKVSIKSARKQETERVSGLRQGRGVKLWLFNTFIDLVLREAGVMFGKSVKIITNGVIWLLEMFVDDLLIDFFLWVKRNGS